MIRKSLTTAVLGIALLSTAALAKDDSKAFLKAAAAGGNAEIQQARLALTMASNPDIQAFAKDIIADHEAVHEKVAALAKTRKVTLAKDLTPKQKAEIERLSKLNDANRSFDRQYLALTIKEHQNTIKAFEKQAESGTDAEAREFAAETLPTLKKHLDDASVLSTRLNLKSNE